MEHGAAHPNLAGEHQNVPQPQFTPKLAAVRLTRVVEERDVAHGNLAGEQHAGLHGVERVDGLHSTAQQAVRQALKMRVDRDRPRPAIPAS